MSDAQLPTSFQDKLRERILSQFVDLIPAEKLDSMIQAEIKDFFETPQFLTVQSTKKEVRNPRYDPAKSSWSGNEPTIRVDCLAFGSHMTPFRQLVWTCLHEYLSPQFAAALNDSETELHQEVNAWVKDIGKPKVVGSTRSMVTDLALVASRTLVSRTIDSAVTSAHYNMRNSLQQAGVDVSRMDMNSTPVVFNNPEHG